MCRHVMYVSVYAHTYIERARERDVYIYIYISSYIYMIAAQPRAFGLSPVSAYSDAGSAQSGEDDVRLDSVAQPS
jgi:hypothetical protein